MEKETTNNQQIREYHFSALELNIRIEDVEFIAHVGEDMPSYSEFLQAEITDLDTKANVRGAYVVAPSSCVENPIVKIGGEVFSVGEQVAGYYQNMEKAAFFVCSAGSEVSLRSKELFDKGDLVEGYLVDVLGTVMVEKAMDKVQELLKLECEEKGWKITNRYSPGYCDWNVAEQKKLFSFFPDNICGIQLSDSCLMHPVKSVSGIIGIGENVDFHKHECHKCGSVNCLYRNVKKER
ncbi:hypothetical protein L3049_21040 [Labilibaculum sp. DW002]|uniref:AdoMet activation domain-containing protein n=1 Tax=Paralabilibaculum antarcticum TaxID=2912572 RepID=A0ABT5VYJ5_9BACT|nr:vitamin B12 dependent-methionine synthase activation domain-containing protein [Labilibaculum sp. DW002]MDE5420485.1 hypothetical protein [Labilibaculum sp. DW002]